MDLASMIDTLYRLDFFLWALPFDLMIAYTAIFVLLLCSALISGSEVAFFSLKLNDVRQLKNLGNQEDKELLYLMGRPRYLLATILISNNFINIAIIILSSFALGESLASSNLAEWLVFLINVVLVTTILVLFGEIAPKVYANIHNLSLARRMSPALIFLMKIFHYPSKLLVKSTQLIEKRLEAQAELNSEINKQEIEQAIALTVQEGDTTAETEAKVLKNIIHFGDASVKQIMRSRVDITVINYAIGFYDLLKVIRSCSFSRIPVFDKTLDSIKGILYVKDLLPYLEEDNDFEWRTYLREPSFVYNTVMIDDLLVYFQREKVHFAIVIDEEYGGTLGIVTLEDILEEIVGEIKDEFDGAVEIDYLQLNETTFLFDGKTMLNDVCRLANIDMDTFSEIRGEAESIGGLMLILAGEIPKVNDILRYEQFQFEVITATDRQIMQLQLTILDVEN